MKPIAVLVLPLLLAVGGCSSIGSAPTPPEDVVVELDAFSGLPNPSWRLLPDEAAALSEHLAAAIPRNDSPVPEQRLGFRGFAIRNPDGDGGIDESLYLTAEGQLVDPVNGSVYAEAPAAFAYLRGTAVKNGYASIIGS